MIFLMSFVDTHTDVAYQIIWPASFYDCNLLKPGYTSTCFTMATTLCSIGMMLTPDLIKRTNKINLHLRVLYISSKGTRRFHQREGLFP